MVLLLAALIGIVHQGQARADVPSWVTTPPKEKNAIVVVGVATAAALEEARQAAILDAARQVGEYITTTFDVRGEKVRTEVELRLMEEMKWKELLPQMAVVSPLGHPLLVWKMRHTIALNRA